MAIVYISHRMNEVFEIGHRVTVLRDGRNVATRLLADVTATDLVQMMANRDLPDQYPERRATRGRELLKVEGLSRRGTLHDINLSLHAGEILGIAGLVGAGRTELARAIIGADPVDAGRITIRGEAARIQTPAAAVRHGVGSSRRIARPTASSWACRSNGTSDCRTIDARRSGASCTAAASATMRERMIDQLRIKTPDADRIARWLSGGNQQKVVLAKWLAGQAEIFIFDEPTRGIDVGATPRHLRPDELARWRAAPASS